MVYKTKCRLFKSKGETITYIIHTGRSLYERLSEHTRDSLGPNQKSHIREHLEERHSKENPKLETTEDVAKCFEVKIVEK